MRDLDKKIPGQTVQEVMSRYNREVSRQVNDRDLKFFEVQVTRQAITNAIVLHFLDLPESERDAIFDRYIAEFERITGLQSGAPAEREAGPGEGRVSETERLVPPRRRKNKGA